MRKKGTDVLVTRIGKDVGLKLKKLFPEGEYAEPGQVLCYQEGACC